MSLASVGSCRKSSAPGDPCQTHSYLIIFFRYSNMNVLWLPYALDTLLMPVIDFRGLEITFPPLELLMVEALISLLFKPIPPTVLDSCGFRL
jgi:hypothetical protein